MTTPSLPTSIPYAFGGSPSGATETGFADLVWRVGPPWLQRSWARKILAAIGSPLDELARLMSLGVRARFPRWDMPGDALILVGRERRIRRGPTEPSSTYAPRLVRWWDDHRGRGGAYALLSQLRAYWTGTHDGVLAVVSHRGVRHEMTGDVIERDVISWGADGTADWAQVWVMIHADADPGAPLSATEEASYLAVPLDWSAAHVLRTHVVILWGEGRLWDYPPPSGDWDAWESGLTWDEWDAEMPIVITHTET